MRVVVDLTHEVNVREVIDVIRSRYSDSELVAQRSTTRSVQTLKEFRSAIGDRLTEKQRSALEAAYAAGYFSWPRESTGEEIANALGVSPPTFHQHLRLGLEELLSASLDES
jgi:predicted DNA binding protein